MGSHSIHVHHHEAIKYVRCLFSLRHKPADSSAWPYKPENNELHPCMHGYNTCAAQGNAVVTGSTGNLLAAVTLHKEIVWAYADLYSQGVLRQQRL